MAELVQRVLRNLTVHQLVPRDGQIVVAVSGGLDSMVLLAVLKQLAAQQEWRLTVAHGHHQLRGAEADADERFVRETAGAYGFPLVAERLPVAAVRRQTRESLEMAARRLRHQFLARTAEQAGIGTIALAHHADDQAELVLLRLLRGSGGEGLGGMGWSDPSPAHPGLRLIRPLLDLTKAELQEFAVRAPISFREDSSNRDRRILRNRIRHELLPWLQQEFNPALVRVLGRTAQVLGAEAGFVAASAQRWRQARRRKAFGQLPVALQRAVLRQQLWEQGAPGDFDLVERLRLDASPVSTDPATRLERTPSGEIRRRPLPSREPVPREAIPLRIGTKPRTVSLAGRTITISVGPFRGVPRRSRAGEESFDARAVGPAITLRHWQDGDRFQPLGFPAAAKLQDLFVNRKVPAARRRSLALGVTASGEIFWVEGLAPGERFKVRPTSRRILSIAVQPVQR